MTNDNLETLFLARARIDAAALARWAGVEIGDVEDAAEEIGAEAPYSYDAAARIVDVLEENEDDDEDDGDDGDDE
jgi:hypothetical protein